MAITQVNSAAYNYATMLDSIIKSYKGLANITISAYDTTAAPDVKVGSVFEDNGALFIVDTSDITPTGYAGIASSTTFYLYYDEDPGAFIYSSTAPTWSDVLQGWYNSNNRAFFSMFKDSGDTLYENKNVLLAQNNYLFPNNIKISNTVKWKKYYKLLTGVTDGIIYTALADWVPAVGDYRAVHGQLTSGTAGYTALWMKRLTTTAVTIGRIQDDTTVSVATFTEDGVSTAWKKIEIMSNFDYMSI